MTDKNPNIFNFEKLLVYQKALNFIDLVYDITNNFPHSEKNNIVDQFRRAAVSIALNIGEGSGGTDKEFNSFLRISKRSVKECIVCTTISHRRKYISDSQENELRLKLIELAKMNSGLSKTIRAKFQPVKSPNSASTPNPTLPSPNS